MLNLIFWVATLAGMTAMVFFAWRSAMRRRGFKLLQLLEPEEVLWYALDVPVVVGESGRGRPSLFARRGTLILTKKRLAGFAHRSRFVLVRDGGSLRHARVSADGAWLRVEPHRGGAGKARVPAFAFRVPDAEAWSREARRVLKL